MFEIRKEQTDERTCEEREAHKEWTDKKGYLVIGCMQMSAD